ncbi:MAG: hypothetical protein DSO07_08385 [Thermoproteota archaeon]|uniref:Uncharacterized protein n=1 Tax=Candidatus Methanodesulfokora washburnensis TaxID=2478471 RepID=A0A3R9X987_9CREN|nr:hypothetical protein [Candidatus Methanodesulfokores washburnensis]RSN78322.1 hypothetical protein D6D85_01165 [Candidatus Methanodesulfokores washburnensis]RZN61927.1 MAG: hypothetical protein EF810_04080 [Candidatus Methanodesulfokores washburnensis]TDA40708.1 MAG: hypothetical protein DSO07_08385 [Candidatus Korarchaeota archaeon]
MGVFDDCMGLKEDELKSVLSEMGVNLEGLDLKDKKVKTGICRIFEAAFEGAGPKEAAHITALARIRGKIF